MLLAALFIGAYIIGGIPFGYLVAKSKGIDIMRVGSGNIGATNVHRAVGKWLGLMVFALDVCKGFAPAATALWLTGSQMWAFWVGMAAVAGHCLSPFLRFNGGTGIATGLGALLGSVPLVALSAFGIFLVMIVITRYVSLSSLIASAFIFPLGLIFHVDHVVNWALAFLTSFIWLRHRANIKRLLAGSEPKFSLQ